MHRRQYLKSQSKNIVNRATIQKKKKVNILQKFFQPSITSACARQDVAGYAGFIVTWVWLAAVGLTFVDVNQIVPINVVSNEIMK